MAVEPRRSGLRIEFYDKEGKAGGRAHISGPCCLVTGQPSDGSGSGDWIYEVYVADDEISLYKLTAQAKPQGFCVLGTSMASKNVQLHYLSDGQMKQEVFASAIGTGEVVDLPAGMSTKKMLVMDGLKLSEASIDELKGTAFYNEWQAGISVLI